MSFNVYKKGETAGTIVVDKENTTLADKAIDVITAPVKFDSDKYVTLTNRATAVIAHGVLFGLLGEALGHRRARQGQQSFLPLMR